MFYKLLLFVSWYIFSYFQYHLIGAQRLVSIFLFLFVILKTQSTDPLYSLSLEWGFGRLSIGQVVERSPRAVSLLLVCSTLSLRQAMLSHVSKPPGNYQISEKCDERVYKQYVKFKLHLNAVTKSRNERVVVKTSNFVTKKNSEPISPLCDLGYKQKTLQSSASSFVDWQRKSKYSI